jgi:hypothetical protein
MNLKNLAIIIMVFLLAGTAACSKQDQDPHHNQLSKKEKEQGYALLFNGQNLDGWHSYLKDQPGSGWSVKNGAIAFNPDSGSGGDLTTDKEYKNYVLELEWKISHGGNSGIIFDVHESPEYDQTYVTGPEMQVLDNENASDNVNKKHLAGSLYDLIAAPKSAAKPAGKWNKVKIKLLDGHLTFWLNGEKVVDTQMWNDHWQELVNHSKFKKWKGFAAYKKGHIALQDHGSRVWYRDIKLKKL